ncbi:MAG TPA: tripartite tricarboxylate transporter substrate binding protein [Xanthobacteraceae bacterium]|nr:tripartite tricarboxylate transporter substrate binding protein [Xanthobacteraceae bacterium]
MTTAMSVRWGNCRKLRAPFGIFATAVAVLLALFAVSAQAAFPERPVRLIVPFAPGGASDLIARVLSAPLAQELGQPVVVENRAGANGNVGIAYVANADPDGYKLLVASSVIFVNQLLKRPDSHDPEKDFTPIADLGGSPDALVTKTDSPIVDFADLIKRAKESPGHITFSSPGIGSISQLGVELLDLRAGIKLTHVPFTGAGPAAQAALAGTTDLAGVNISAVMPLIKAGSLRALVQTGAKRWYELPDTPTMEEAGIANAESETLQVLLAPPNLPSDVTDRLSKAVVKVLAAPELRDQLLKTGFAVSGTGSAALKKLIGSEVAKWRTVIAEAELTVN